MAAYYYISPLREIMLIDKLDADISGRALGNRTLLHLVAREGNTRWIMERCHIDVAEKSEDGRTSMHIIASNGCLEFTRLLTEEYGADVNVKDMSQTPLHLVASDGYVELVKLLIDHYKTSAILGMEGRADVNNQDDEGTPLHLAIERGDANITRIVRALVIKGRVDVNM